MNERIKELAQQAWDSLIDEMGNFTDDGGNINWNFISAYDKRYANFIINECVKELDNLVLQRVPASEYSKLLKEKFNTIK